MGFRFNKSVKLGGGFRVNFSKKGVGYSWGTKGYRVTKTAKGTTRRTASIPGTGISYVTETSSKNKKKKQNQNINNVTFDCKEDSSVSPTNISNSNDSEKRTANEKIF